MPCGTLAGMAIPVLGYLGKAIGFLGLSHTIDADANGVRIYPAPVNGVVGCKMSGLY